MRISAVYLVAFVAFAFLLPNGIVKVVKNRRDISDTARWAALIIAYAALSIALLQPLQLAASFSGPSFRMKG